MKSYVSSDMLHVIFVLINIFDKAIYLKGLLARTLIFFFFYQITVAINTILLHVYASKFHYNTIF